MFSKNTMSAVAVLSLSVLAHAQMELDSQSTLPIVITRSVSASKAAPGDSVLAKTLQTVQLPDGRRIPSGALVTGHVIVARGFSFDKKHYANQTAGQLTVHFDSVQVARQQVPLNVTVRALADVIVSNDAYAPLASDLDSRSTRTLIGGDKLYESQDGVEDSEGDVVGYERRNGLYAHLIPSRTCDGNSFEVSMGIYSPSACGVYGFAGVRATERGSVSFPSTLTLVSSRRSPELPKHATALLEVLPSQQASLAPSIDTRTAPWGFRNERSDR